MYSNLNDRLIVVIASVITTPYILLLCLYLRKNLNGSHKFFSFAILRELYMRFDPHGRVKPKAFLNATGVCYSLLFVIKDLTTDFTTIIKVILAIYVVMSGFVWWRYGKPALDYLSPSVMISSGVLTVVELAWGIATAIELYTMFTAMMFGMFSSYVVRKIATSPVGNTQVYTPFD